MSEGVDMNSPAENDGVCRHCDGDGCEACDARFLDPDVHLVAALSVKYPTMTVPLLAEMVEFVRCWEPPFPRVAVVRPTRDQIAAIIAWPWPPSTPPPHPFGDIVPTQKDFDAADALLAEFWPGTPEPADEGDAT